MKHYKKHIDSFFKEKLGNYRETPPADAWSDLEAKLDGLKPGTPRFAHRWVLHLAIVSTLLFLGVSIVKKIASSPAISEGEGVKTVATQTLSAATQKNGTNANISAGTQTNNAVNNAQVSNSAITNNIATANNAVTNTAKVPNIKNNSKSPAASARSAAQNGQNANSAPAIATNYTTTNNHYSINSPNPAPEEANENSQPQLQAASPNTTLSVVNKPAEAQANPESTTPVNKPSTSTANKNSRTRNKAEFQRFEAGIKAGYEGGFSSGADNKLVVSPYLQYNLTPSLSVMTQPGVKLAVTPNTNIGSPQTYYNIDQESTSLTQGPTVATTKGVTTYYTTPYTYTQTHDSIVKSNKTGGSSMQYEIPILLKYKLTKKLSAYAGVNFVYNKFTTITENTYSKSVTRTLDTTVVSTSVSQPTFGFSYAGSPIANYKKLAADQTGYEFSTGYMIGFSYNCSKKLLIDALIEQNPVAPDMKAGYNINTPLSVPYFRLTVGYNFTK